MEDSSFIAYSSGSPNISQRESVLSINFNNLDTSIIKKNLFQMSTPETHHHQRSNGNNNKYLNTNSNTISSSSILADCIKTSRIERRLLSDITNDPNNMLYGKKGHISSRSSSSIALNERSSTNNWPICNTSGGGGSGNGDGCSSTKSSAKKFTIHFKKNRNNTSSDVLNSSRDNSVINTRRASISNRENLIPKPDISMNLEGMLNKSTDNSNMNINEKISRIKSKFTQIDHSMENIAKTSQKLQEKHNTITQLIKGSEFTKISFKSSKYSRRFIFYCETLGSICWRDPKNKFPKPNQVIPIKDIINICTHIDKSKSSKRLTNLKLDDTLFLSIETKDRSLDLLAPNIDTKNQWIRSLNLLMLIISSNFHKQYYQDIQYNDLVTIENNNNNNNNLMLLDLTPIACIFYQDINEINNAYNVYYQNMLEIKDDLDIIKDVSKTHNDKLKKSYMESTDNIIKKEKLLYHSLEKSYKELNKEFQFLSQKRSELQNEISEIKREYDSLMSKNKDMIYELKLYKEDKVNTIKCIKEYQRKLHCYVEYIHALDFQLEAGNVTQPLKPCNNNNSNTNGQSNRASVSFSMDFNSSIIGTNQGNNNGNANGNKFDMNNINNDVQNSFDNLIFKTNEIHKNHIKLKEEIKQLHENKKQIQTENDNLTKKHNEIWSLYNESIKEKEKLYNQLENLIQNSKDNTVENTKLKDEIKSLYGKIEELKNECNTKDKELQNLMIYAQKVKVDMDNHNDVIKKEANHHEIKKLCLLEEKYTKEIIRYENKIMEAEKNILELDHLIKGYENDIEQYMKNLKNKDEEIMELTNAKDKLILMINELEEKSIKNEIKQQELEDLKGSRDKLLVVISELQQKLAFSQNKHNSSDNTDYSSDNNVNSRNSKSNSNINEEINHNNNLKNPNNYKLSNIDDDDEDNVHTYNTANANNDNNDVNYLNNRNHHNYHVVVDPENSLYEQKFNSLAETLAGSTRKNSNMKQQRLINNEIDSIGNSNNENQLIQLNEYREQIKELESKIINYENEIGAYNQEKITYNQQYIKLQENEEQYKIKIVKLQDSLKTLLEEQKKIKKANRNLELNLSYWLNLVYLNNLTIYFHENLHMINHITSDIHLIILNSGIKKVKDAFDGICYKNEFYKALIKNIEESIPNIAFDPNIVEICKLYNYKISKEINEMRKARDSANSTTSISTNETMLFIQRDKSANRKTLSQNSILIDSVIDESNVINNSTNNTCFGNNNNNNLSYSMHQKNLSQTHRTNNSNNNNNNNNKSSKDDISPHHHQKSYSNLNINQHQTKGEILGYGVNHQYKNRGGVGGGSSGTLYQNIISEVFKDKRC